MVWLRLSWIETLLYYVLEAGGHKQYYVPEMKGMHCQLDYAFVLWRERSLKHAAWFSLHVFDFLRVRSWRAVRQCCKNEVRVFGKSSRPFFKSWDTDDDNSDVEKFNSSIISPCVVQGFIRTWFHFSGKKLVLYRPIWIKVYWKNHFRGWAFETLKAFCQWCILAILPLFQLL